MYCKRQSFGSGFRAQIGPDPWAKECAKSTLKSFKRTVKNEKKQDPKI